MHSLIEQVASLCHAGHRTKGTPMVRSPGLYDGISDLEYHADIDWLSSSGLRELIKPGGPARFHYARDTGSIKHKAYFDEGHAAHAEVLRTGMETVEVKEKDWRSARAQAARTQAYEDGKVPLLTAGVEMVRGMGEVVRADPAASALLSGGRPEVSAYTEDAASWTRLRARPDYLIERWPGVVSVCDYKTTADASPRGFASSAAKYGYWIQEAVYRRVLRGLDIEVDRFTFLAQEKEPPYLLSMHVNDPEDVALGDRLIDFGIEIYTDCTASGVWPGYGNNVHFMRLPAWARFLAEELLA